MKGDEEVFVFISCVRICMLSAAFSDSATECMQDVFYTYTRTLTHTLVIKLVLQWGFCVQYVFISCLVLHLITGKSHGCTEFSNLSFGSAEENPTPLLFPAFKIFLCN